MVTIKYQRVVLLVSFVLNVYQITDSRTLQSESKVLFNIIFGQKRGELQFVKETTYNCTLKARVSKNLMIALWHVNICVYKKFRFCLHDHFLPVTGITKTRGNVIYLMCGKFIIENYSKRKANHLKLEPLKLQWRFAVPRGFYLNLTMNKIDIKGVAYTCITGHVIVHDLKSNKTHGPLCGLHQIQPWQIYLNGRNMLLKYVSFPVRNYPIRHLVIFTVQAVQVERHIAFYKILSIMQANKKEMYAEYKDEDSDSDSDSN